MTDQTIPAGLTPEDAKKAREWALHALNKPGASTTAEKAVARVVLAALPAPTRPTLADMTDEERRACQWMLADVEDHSRRYVIANPSDEEGDAVLIDPDGEIKWIFPEYVTPRPDLPRMECPRDTGIPGVVVGKPITDPDVIKWVGEHAPDGTVVEDCAAIALKAPFGWVHDVTGKSDMALALGYADVIGEITVVRWGE